jgi:hypothetical protein
MRRAIWRRLHPGVPGPFPPVYEKGATSRGIASYALLRGLVIAQRTVEDTLPAIPGRPPAWARLAGALITWLSRGRFASQPDDLLYVIRKPEDRSARVVVS